MPTIGPDETANDLSLIHTPWLVPEVIAAALILAAVLFKVSRHGGQVLYALQQVCVEHGIQRVGEAAPAAEDHQRAALG